MFIFQSSDLLPSNPTIDNTSYFNDISHVPINHMNLSSFDSVPLYQPLDISNGVFLSSPENQNRLSSLPNNPNQSSSLPDKQNESNNTSNLSGMVMSHCVDHKRHSSRSRTIHPMITRSTASIFKPKSKMCLFIQPIQEIEPLSYKDVL